LAAFVQRWSNVVLGNALLGFKGCDEKFRRKNCDLKTSIATSPWNLEIF
jgi:hypothetical protein